MLFDVFFYQAEEDYCVITFNSGFVTWAGYWSLVGQLTLPTFFMFYAYIQMTVSIRAINIPPPPPLPPTDSSTSTASTTQLAGKTIWHHHSASLKFILTLTVYLRQWDYHIKFSVIHSAFCCIASFVFLPYDGCLVIQLNRRKLFFQNFLRNWNCAIIYWGRGTTMETYIYLETWKLCLLFLPLLVPIKLRQLYQLLFFNPNKTHLK